MFGEPMVSRYASADARTVRGGTARIRVTVPAIAIALRCLPRITGPLRVRASAGPPQVDSHDTSDNSPLSGLWPIFHLMKDCLRQQIWSLSCGNLLAPDLGR